MYLSNYLFLLLNNHRADRLYIKVNSLSRDDLGGISRAKYTFKYFKYHHCYLRVILYPVSVIKTL